MSWITGRHGILMETGNRKGFRGKNSSGESIRYKIGISNKYSEKRDMPNNEVLWGFRPQGPTPIPARRAFSHLAIPPFPHLYSRHMPERTKDPFQSRAGFPAGVGVRIRLWVGNHPRSGAIEQVLCCMEDKVWLRCCTLIRSIS